MRHAILGNGNLGNAIAKEVNNHGMEFKIFSTTTGWKYPANDLTPIHDYFPDHVWVTVGAGSVEQAKVDYRPFVDLHVRLPMELSQTLNSSVTLHLFSTDYCNVVNSLIDPQSLYALSKSWMEQAIVLQKRPKTFIYRIGSLYGAFKPFKCFPAKLKRNAANRSIALPPNRICPTPVDWLAAILVDPILIGVVSRHSLLSVSPSGSTTVKEWGELILGREVEMAEIDASRPSDSTVTSWPSLFGMPDWLELWKEREKEI